MARFIHIVSAALWAGAAIFTSFILGPSMIKAGPAAGPFMGVVLRRGGFSPYFMSVGTLTVVSGLYLYYAYDYHSQPFGSSRAVLITIGALLAVLAYVHGLSAMLPNERRMKTIARSMPPGAAPTPDKAAELGRLGQKQGKMSAASTIMIAATLLLMTISRLF